MSSQASPAPAGELSRASPVAVSSAQALSQPALPKLPLPKGPVFGWAALRHRPAPTLPSVEDLPQLRFTTSGRAAIHQALQLLKLPAGSAVLLPTYHCPTMVAPVLMLGLQPTYFGIDSEGLPELASITAAQATEARAMLVSHYFGLPRSLAAVRAWCDERGIALIEDCAHSYFGQAGERAIGHWGDYATASVSKFFPVPEAGVLASATRQLPASTLQPQSFKAQLKAWVDVLEIGTRHRRLAGLQALLAPLFRLKSGPVSTRVAPAPAADTSADELMQGCDMGRISAKPLALSLLLREHLPQDRIIALRQRNFALYEQWLGEHNAMPGLGKNGIADCAPYVYPFWVEDADRIYHALREQGLPVFRWDRLWPGTPELPQDQGRRWSRHLLQLLCHQDLGSDDVQHTARQLLSLLPQRQHPSQQEVSPT
ncbi:DegT/DnrJ/EryC1/StrS aminotransferase family protein [Pelomonas sp. V22]|uniref:DegT/DnrJ/EryC1/StrS family aminotransferase n=1 Tax=Pelomonas sp. V22 TaxID=2822139 RepID=UPI0024A8E4F4|nr:DegT/DnrJ/EryC1/StrS family aminotransferase [Pelomonas sp. V22]MDI4631688.1 DegT/DnrJ/EryC1/StrS aminotransferase family protein [Pelomonas sp. V22]